MNNKAIGPRGLEAHHEMQMRMKPTYPIHFIIPSCSILFPSNNFLTWTLAPPQRKSSPVAAEVQTTSNLAQSIRLPSLFLILTQIFLNSLPLIWIEAKKIWTLETKLSIKWGLWGRWSPNLRVLAPWKLSYIVAMLLRQKIRRIEDLLANWSWLRWRKKEYQR